MSIFIDPNTFPDDAYGRVQLVFLLVVYGYILSKSSGLISDGSELLLLIPPLAGIVGSVVLPVLGAVPDGAIVLFSGFGPDAQQQLSVGVGALAGSTIMLLTIPWALCIWMGRVDIVNGEANYKGKPKLTNKFSYFGSGITPRNSIFKNGIIMMATCISYIIIQGAAFGSDCDYITENGCAGDKEHWWALASLLVCVLAFCGYLYYNVRHANDEDKEDKLEEVRRQAIESHIISFSAAFESELATEIALEAASKGGEEEERSNEKRINNTLLKFFHKYDQNGDNVIDQVELKLLLTDIGEDMSEDRFTTLWREIDSDNNGVISFKEFCDAIKLFVAKKIEYSKDTQHRISLKDLLNIGAPVKPNSSGLSSSSSVKVQTRSEERDSIKLSAEAEGTIDLEKGPATGAGAEGGEGDEEDSEEEEEEVPEDLANLPPKQQKLRILWRAVWMMGFGTGITLLFSDPMVDVLNTLGDRFNIGAFYVAFVLAPIASNASELIASINYAQKKTRKTITISMAALEGAACMNNTFCLGIFLCLIFGRGLIWEFSAETITIVFVEIVLFGFTFKKTHTLLEASIIIALYPFSIFLVWVIENKGHLN